LLDAARKRLKKSNKSTSKERAPAGKATAGKRLKRKRL